MEPGPSGGSSPTRKRNGMRARTRIDSLDHDILHIIFSFLNIFDLVRCTVVCKSWNAVLNRSKLLHYKMWQNYSEFFNDSNSSRRELNLSLEELAKMHHSLSLREGRIDIDQWRGHSVRDWFLAFPFVRIDQCRMKMGLLLTGVGDKVMRLWSLDRYKCVEEYSVPDNVSLVDFDFDESKVIMAYVQPLSPYPLSHSRSHGL
ncbi:hypothetical protein SLEP1_g2828 [Rubroshorea leprosula]|uniref:F-box domain-containing protein n=1 Tax=Rubroshorea leprosula TaxID=152421 RepID=A0AAV5HPE7_9ROSI|nr:hypothetical protein SLEP1_g2828 [Rubroshorea leprosula]